MKHQPVKQGQTTTPGTSSPTLCEKCVGSLTSSTEKMQETGPTVFRPYPRRRYMKKVKKAYQLYLESY